MVKDPSTSPLTSDVLCSENAMKLGSFGLSANRLYRRLLPSVIPALVRAPSMPESLVKPSPTMPSTPYERMGLLALDASMNACFVTLMLQSRRSSASMRKRIISSQNAYPANSTGAYEMWPYVDPMPYCMLGVSGSQEGKCAPLTVMFRVYA